MSKGYVYILTNPAMPGYVKIGKTTGDPRARASQLQSTGVPIPFEVAHYVFSPDCGELERIAHEEMAGKRVSPSREFFRCEVMDAVRLLDNCHNEQVFLWLSEYKPDHVFIEADLCVDTFQIDRIADEAGEPQPVIVDALEEITVEELMPAIRRVYERIQRAKFQSEMGLE